MNTSTGLAIYHPSRLTRDDFVAGFVARGEFVDFLLDKLRYMPEVAEHHVVVGQRGMGKTSLLRRLAIGISDEKPLRERYVPLTFREEQYNVRSLDIFWRNCGESLAEWCDVHGNKDAANELDASMLTPVWRSAETAAEKFLSAANKLGGRPVLFVDNLDLILEALPSEQHWELRRVLQQPGGPIIFGAAPQMLRESADRDAAFYEFFHPHVLEPLTEGELLQCMGRLADARGEAGRPVREILAVEPERLRTLHALTGGNPRVLTLVYQLLERTESNAVFSDLEALLDHLTPFYKARVEEYQTDLQRAVIDAIALNWHPVTSHHLSQLTAIDVTTISSQLIRFRRDGLVEEVGTSGSRSGYQLVERFFNIWYLMRHGTRQTRQKIRWLTAFLMSFYAPTELTKMKAELRVGARHGVHPFLREALDAVDDGSAIGAFEGVSTGSVVSSKERLRPIEGSEAILVDSQSAHSLNQRALKLAERGARDDAIAVWDDVIDRFGAADEADLQWQVAQALTNKGITLGELGRRDEELDAYDEVVNRYSLLEDLTLVEQVARALNNKGIALGELGRVQEEIATYDCIVNRATRADQPELVVQVVRAHINKAITFGENGRDEEEIAIYEDVVRRYEQIDQPEVQEEITRALFNKANRLGQQGRREEELAVYDDLVTRFGAAERSSLRLAAGEALLVKGIVLGDLGRSEDEISAYDEIVRRFGAEEDAEIRECVARALFNKGLRLGALKRSQEAIFAYDDLLKKFGAAEQLEFRQHVARALINMGGRYGDLGRQEEEMAVYDDLISRFGNDSEFGEQIARATVNKAGVLGERGLNEQAVKIYRDVVSRFEHDPTASQQIARALAGQAVALVELGRLEEAIEVFDDIIDRFENGEGSEFSKLVARALINKGLMLGKLNRSDEEIAVYDNILSRFGDAGGVLSPLEEVARALFNKGVTLGDLGRSGEAIATYDELVSRFGNVAETDIRDSVAKALFNMAVTLGEQGRFEEEISVYNDLVRRFGSDNSVELREEVARALVNKGVTLGQLGRREEEVSVYDYVVNVLGDENEPELREQSARASLNKAIALDSLGQHERALAAYEDLDARFGSLEGMDIQDILVRSLWLRVNTYLELEQVDPAEAACRKALEVDPANSSAWNSLGNILLDYRGSLAEAERAFRTAISISDEDSVATANLAWALLISNRLTEARKLRASLTNLHLVGQGLIDAAIALADDNFGAATEKLAAALTADEEQLEAVFSEDFFRLLRLAEKRGYGQKLLDWIKASGLSERHAPTFAAFMAYVNGEKFLLDFSPEVRKPAEQIYRWLCRNRTDHPSLPVVARRRRGRPRLKKPL